MKNRMVLRKTLNKISTFLKMRKKSYSSITEARRNQRNPMGLPNSTKLGAGSHKRRLTKAGYTSIRAYRRSQIEKAQNKG